MLQNACCNVGIRCIVLQNACCNVGIRCIVLQNACFNVQVSIRCIVLQNACCNVGIRCCVLQNARCNVCCRYIVSLVYVNQKRHKENTTWNMITYYEPPRGKTNNVVSDQFRHEPSCTAREAGQKLDILDLSRGGIVLSA